jgi:hypothetical protein
MMIATAYVEIRADTAAGRREAVAGAKKMAGEATAAAESGNQAQVRSAQQAGDKIRAEQDKTVRKAKSAAQQIGEFFAAGIFLKGVNDTVNAASRLQQSVGATEAVFKASSSVIDDFAKSSADAYGISSSAARELTAQIGSMLKGFGFSTQAAAEQSVVLAQLGADLSATFGGKPEEAVQALGAALRGEFDPLERFGISLNVAQANLKAVELGLAANKNEVDLQARAQAALAIIMERSADAQGQFAREADTYAGQQARATAAAEDARAKFGEQLLPVMTRVQQAVGFLAEGFGELPGPIQLAAVGLVGFVALAGPLQTLGSNAKDVVDALKKMSTAGVAMSATAAGIAAAVVIGYLAYQSMTSKQREVTARAKEVAGALDEATSAAIENADATNGAAIAHQALSDALTDTGDDGEKLTKALGQLGFTAADALDVLTSIGRDSDPAGLRALAESAGLSGKAVETLITIVGSYDRIDDIKMATKTWGDTLGVTNEELLAVAIAMEEVDDQAQKSDLDAMIGDFLSTRAASSDLAQQLLAQAEEQTGLKRTGDELLPLYEVFTGLLAENKDALADAEGAASGAATSIGDLGDEQEEAKRKTADLTEAQGFLSSVLDAVDQAASDLADALDRVFGRYTSLEEANRGLAAAGDELAKSLTDNGTTLDINTEAGRKNREEIQKGVDAIDTWAQAWVASGKPTEDAVAGINLFTEGLRQQLIDAGFTEQAVDEYLTTLGRTPENVETTVALLGEEQQARRIEEYKKLLEEIPEEEFTKIEAALGDGDLAEAERLIDAFLEEQRQKSIRIPVTVSTGNPVLVGGPNGTVKVAASGAYSNRAQVGLWGEDGAEWVAPLTKPRQMAQWLEDPRIRGPVVAGLAAGGPGTMRGMVAMANGGLVGSSWASSFGTAVTTVFGSAGDAEAATRGLIAAVQQLRGALEETGGDLGANLDLVDAQRDAIFRWAEAQLAAGRSTEDVSADVKYWIQDLRDNAVQLGVNEQAIDEYLNRIGLVPSNVDTVIELVGAEEAKRQYDELIERQREAKRGVLDYANETADALGRAADAVRRQRDELLGLWDATVSLDRAQSRVTEGRSSLAGRVFDAGSRIDSGAGREAAIGQIDAIWQLAKAQIEGGASATAVGAMVDRELAGLRGALREGGVSDERADQFLRQIGRTPEDFMAMLRAFEGSSQTLDRLADASDRLDSAIASDDVDAIDRAAGGAQSLVVELRIDGNVYGDAHLRQMLERGAQDLADQIRQLLGV